MLEVGQRVKHRSFGTGTVRQLRHDQPTPTALVEWDTHRVSEPWSGYSEAYSWVYQRSLRPESQTAGRAGGWV
jgi:hypothetical protein